MTPVLRYLLGALAICALDILTSSDITLWIGYLAPIGAASWNLRRSAGYQVGATSAILNIATWSYEPLPHSGLGAAIVLGSRIAVFVIVIELVSSLRCKEVRRVFHPTQSKWDE